MLLSGVFLLAALVFLALYTLLRLSFGMFVATVLLYAASLLLFGRSTAKVQEYPPAFDGAAARYVQVCAFLCCGGFVLETANSLLSLFQYCSGDYVVAGRAPLLIISALSALLAAFSMAMAALTFGSQKYDFRRIPVMPFFPLVWALLRVICMLTGYAADAGANASFFEVFALVFALAFFYRFAFESLRHEGAFPQTVFFAGALFLTGVMLFFGRLFALASRTASVSVSEMLFAASAMLMAVFALAFGRNIAYKLN